MSPEDELPSIGEVVVCKVKQVLAYGCFVELLEYDNIKGFIHVSQVASRWVKNIRNFVKEGQVRAAKVTSINRERNQIDLSLVKVNSAEQRARIEEFKQLKRNKKLLELLAKQHKVDEAVVWEAVAEPLVSEYGSLFGAFQKIALEGESAVKGVDAKWIGSLVELVKKNVVVPEKTIKGFISICSLKEDGVEIIKEALEKGMKSTKDAEIEIYYAGAGKYAVKVTSFDFKVAERVLQFVEKEIVSFIKAAGGTAEFTRAA